MKLAVVGSRDYPKPELVKRVLSKYPSDTVLISGGARGVDSLAEEAARDLFVPEPVIYPAKWRTDNGKYDRGAGFKRNQLIIRDADQVIAFWDGESKGTQHSISLAIKSNTPVAVFDPTGALMMVAE